MSIDPRAVVDPSAEVSDNVTIGPFSVIGPKVKIGEGTVVGPHVVINGPTTIGENNTIYQFSSIGEIPQDKKYHGESSCLEIGDRNTIREFVTINRGTDDGGGVTKIGNDNWLMAYIHIAHDSIIGNHTTFSNGASLAGHVIVEDHASLGGFTLVHQFCKIGRHAFCGMASAISKDVLPFTMVSGNPAHPFGSNSEGLKRNDFTKEQIKNIKDAYRIIYRSGLTVENAIEKLNTLDEQNGEIKTLVDFLQSSTRGIIR